MKSDVTRNAREMYDRYRVGDHYSHAHTRVLTERSLVEFLSGVQPGERLLDIGCGAGYWVDTAAGMGIPAGRIAALDISFTNCSELRRRGFDTACGDSSSLPFADAISDHTVCSGVLHHTAQPFDGFRELVRITRPGGRIYLAVYNIWHPYFYVVHKATAPIRAYYWKRNRRIADVVYPVAKLFLQALSLLLKGERMDDRTARIVFMDQVMTPRAELFSKSRLRSYAVQCGCTIESFAYAYHYLMIACTIRVNNRAPGASSRV